MSEKKLDTLQELLVDELIDKIKSGKATASELNVSRQLLKDAGYEFIQSSNSPLIKAIENLPFEQNEVMTAFKKQG
jgi:hypothetical protein